jgi:hypothetical protein
MFLSFVHDIRGIRVIGGYAMEGLNEFKPGLELALLLNFKSTRLE